jgi:hypothetical protein
VVEDTTGAPLPGVTVEASSPALIESTRSAVTDARGMYRIDDLRPGDYSVRFALAGFSSVTREGVALSTGFNSTVNATLSVGAINETIYTSDLSSRAAFLMVVLGILSAVGLLSSLVIRSQG